MPSLALMNQFNDEYKHDIQGHEPSHWISISPFEEREKGRKHTTDHDEIVAFLNEQTSETNP